MKDEGLKSKEEYFEKVWRDLKANKENYKSMEGLMCN